MLTLALIRHAKTCWNEQKKLQGRQDIALSQAGIDALTGRQLKKKWQSFHWYCSPLLRAQHTAKLLNISVKTEPALIEMNFGDWEGKNLARLRHQRPKLMASLEAKGVHMQPPRGESPAEVAERVKQWLITLGPGNYGLICHKGVIRALLAMATGWDMTNKPPININWSLMLNFTFDGTRLHLTDFNVDFLEKADVQLTS